MTARRRSRRRRPLTDFARRSPIHAVAAGLIRFTLLVAVALIAYTVSTNVLVAGMVDGLVEEFRSQRR